MSTRSTRSSSGSRADATTTVATASPRLPFHQRKPKRELVAPSPSAATPGKHPRTMAADRARPMIFGSPVQPKLISLPPLSVSMVDARKAPWRPADAEAGSRHGPQVQKTAPIGSRLAIKSSGMDPRAVFAPVIATVVLPLPPPPLTNPVSGNTKATGGRKKSCEPSGALSKPSRPERRRLPVDREWEQLPFPLPFPLEVERLDFAQATGLTNEEAMHTAHVLSPPPKSMFAAVIDRADSPPETIMDLFASACGDFEPPSGSTPPRDREFVAAVHKAYHERSGGSVTPCSLPSSPIRLLAQFGDVDWESITI